jgi:hypothetical protein
LIQIIDTVIETDGRTDANPIDGAIRVDHLLARIDAPARDDIRRLLFVTEWILPLLIFKPVPFTVLGSNDRRRAIERVVDSRFGLLRDVARFFKTAGCVGYYGSPPALAEIGYIPFDMRPRSVGVAQAPAVHTEPVIWAD